MQMEAEQLLEQARAVLRSRIDVPLKDAISAFRRALVAGSAVAAAELALLFLARPRASTLFGLTAHEAFAAATASHNRGCSSGTAALSWFHRCADFSDIDQNAELAVSLATQAATGNDAWGLYALGVCLLANASARLHRSIDSDVADAEVDEQAGLELLERAADDGLPIAVHTLALVYEARDENEVADALFRRAIELHHPAAAAHLGSRLLSCATDAGTRGDALKLLEPAARADEVEALLALSRFYADDAPLKAIELCQRAVLLDPTEATALLTDLQSRVTPSADTSVIASASSPVSAASPPSSSVASSPTIINQTTPISLASLAASPSSPEQPPSLASIASASSPVNSRLVRSNSDLESPPIKSPLLSSFHLDSPTMAPLSMAVSKASSPTLTATKTSTPKIELSAKIAPAAMTITVSDPETRMNWGTKHLTYLVTSAHAAVRRRFSDFVWLRDILCNQYPGFFVPPLPPKKALGILDDSFLDERLSDLGRFLTRLSSYGIWRDCVAFRAFLTRADAEQMEDIEESIIKQLNAENSGSLRLRYAHWLPELFGPDAPLGLDVDAKVSKERHQADQAAEFEARRAFDAAKKAESALAQLLESIRLSAVSRRQAALDMQSMSAKFRELKAFPEAIGFDMFDQFSRIARFAFKDDEIHQFQILEAVRRKHQDAEAVVELFCARFEVSQKLAEARRDADEWRTPEALAEFSDLSQRQLRNRAEHLSQESDLALRLRTIDRLMRVHSLPRAHQDARHDFQSVFRHLSENQIAVCTESARLWREIGDMCLY